MTDKFPSNFTQRPIFSRLIWLGYRETTAKHIEIKFAGLYDTVVSIVGSQHLFWSGNKSNQRAVSLATKSVHLAAAEEHRKDFPLHTIKSAKDNGKGKEFYLPGVHSDVGGSYNLANKALADKQNHKSIYVKNVLKAGDYSVMAAEKILLIKSGRFRADQLVVEVTEHNPNGRNKGKLIELRTLDTTEYMRSSSEVNMNLHENYYTELSEDMKWLYAQGWYHPGELNIDIKVGDMTGNLVSNRKNIKSAYSNIPLKLMAKFARENQIEINPKLRHWLNKLIIDS